MRTNRQKRGLKNYRTGLWAELLAMLWLMAKLYLPLYRRYKTPFGEIDLIAKRGRMVIFVEIKKRADRTIASDSIGHTQQRRIIQASNHFLSRHPQFGQNHYLRYDAILICPNRLPQHIVAAWS